MYIYVVFFLCILFPHSCCDAYFDPFFYFQQCVICHLIIHSQHPTNIFCLYRLQYWLFGPFADFSPLRQYTSYQYINTIILSLKLFLNSLSPIPQTYFHFFPSIAYVSIIALSRNVCLFHCVSVIAFDVSSYISAIIATILLTTCNFFTLSIILSLLTLSKVAVRSANNS